MKTPRWTGPLLFAAVGLAAPVSVEGQDAGPSECRPAQLSSTRAGASGSMTVSDRGRLCAPWRSAVPGDVDLHEERGGEGVPGQGETFLASLVVPGAGQWLRGESRGYVYLALEAAGWAAYLHRRSEGRRLRGSYRDLAWRTARSGSAGPRVEGDFGYYEALARYPASGAWDAEPDRPGLQPETDPSTYNGSIWALARDLYLSGDGEPGSEARSRALEFYRTRGYSQEMAWDWTGDAESLDRFRDLIDESDGAFRHATLLLGVVAANHLVSAVDGFVTGRSSSAGAPSVRLESAPEPTGRIRLRIDLPLRR